MRTRIKVEGISSRTIVEEENGEIYLIKDKKSRIIMKEGLQIVEMNEVVKGKYNRNIVLETTAPVCSKTITLLNDNEIKLVQK